MGGDGSKCSSGNEGNREETSGAIYSSENYGSSEFCQWNLQSSLKEDELLVFRIAENNVDCNEADFQILGNQFCGRTNEICATYSPIYCQSVQINAVCQKLVGEHSAPFTVVLTGKKDGVTNGGFNMTYEYSKCYKETTTKSPISTTDLPSTQSANETSTAQITSTIESSFANESVSFSETLPETSEIATSVFSTTTENNNNGDELNGAVIGAVIVVAIVLISLIIILLFFVARRKREKKNEANGVVYAMATDSSGNSTAINPIHYSLPPDADNFTIARDFVVKHSTVKPIPTRTGVYEDPNIDSNEIYCEIDVKDEPESGQIYELPITDNKSENETPEKSNTTSEDNAEIEIQYTNLIQTPPSENGSEETDKNSEPRSGDEEEGKMVDNVLYIHKGQSKV